MPHRNIALISYHTCPLAHLEGKETGGMNIYVLELSKALGDLGYQVDIFTRSEADSPKVVHIHNNVRLFHLEAGPKKEIAKKQVLKLILKFVQKLALMIRQEKIQYDLINAHYYQSGMVALELNKILTANQQSQIPIIINFHTLALMKSLVARTADELPDAVRIKAEFDLINQSEAIVAPSFDEAEYLRYLYGASIKKITLISPGYNPQFFFPLNKIIAKRNINADVNHKILLYVGRIEPLKGIDGLLYATKIIKAKYPTLPLCLWVVGADMQKPKSAWSAELQRLDNLKHLLQLTTVVKFVPQQSQENLINYYNAAEVVVMPSHYESFGMSALEALACEIPVVTTNVAGVTNILNSNQQDLIVTVNNPLMLAEQLERMLLNDLYRQSVMNKLKQQVKDFTWQNVALKTGELYEKIIQQ